MTIYHMVNWFFALSLFGYILECIVLTCESKTPILNRGFGHGPFCIIYGFGATGACLLLTPISNNTIALYFSSMLMATILELITAALMIRFFGSFWWDYSKKMFNYRGIICMESSLGWGFLGIFFFRFLNGFIHNLVEYIPQSLEKFIALALLSFYLADFAISVRMQLRESEENDETVIGRLKLY